MLADARTASSTVREEAGHRVWSVVSDTVVSFDQDPDDTYREPPHRFAAIAKVTGCY